jgi:transposase
VKLVSWERTGWWLFAKRLEHGRLRFPQAQAKQELSVQGFQLLRDGIALGRRPSEGEPCPLTLAERAATLSQAESVALLQPNHARAQQTADLQRQVAWCKRPLCGRKSERRVREPDAQQLPLAGLLPVPGAPAETPPPPTETVKAYQGRSRFTAVDDPAEESDLRCDRSVPVAVSELPNPELVGLTPDASEVSGEKLPYRVVQRPGADGSLKDVRKVLKRKESQALVCPPAPPAVLEKSWAAVSVLAGLRLDTFRYSLPL